jgi:serpin B
LLAEEAMDVMFQAKGKAGAILVMATLLLLAVPLVFLSCKERGTDSVEGKQAASAAQDASPVAGGLKPNPQTKSGVEAVVEGNNAFALELYQRLKTENAGKNLFFSPFSISAALAMTYAGARGTTEKQMARVLRFTLDPRDLHPAFQSMMAQVNPIEGDVLGAPEGSLVADLRKQYVTLSRQYRSLLAAVRPDHPDMERLRSELDAAGEALNKVDKNLIRPGECEVHIANALWGQTGYPWLPDFLDLIRVRYKAALNEVDFVSDPGGASRTINAWAEDRTRGKIKDVLNAGDIDAFTRLLVTSAIYFKGDWLRQFQTNHTIEAPFHLADGTQVQAPLMDQTETYPYAKADGIQVLELAYVGEELSMMVFLPKEADGLESLEGSLTSENLRKWTQALKGQEVHVILPTFRAESWFNVKETLASMGMVDAFVPDKADFSGMNGGATGDEGLFIGQVIHKASIAVDEAGTEAAAATAVEVGFISFSEPKRTPVFRADHPFLFLIRDNKTGSILFLGRLMNPKA